MRRITCVLIFVCALCVAVCVPQSVRAQNLSAQSPDIQAFVKQYVAAFNAKDLARLYALNYSKSGACITPATKDFYEGSLAMQMRDSIPANYTATVFAGQRKQFESDREPRTISGASRAGIAH